MGPANTHVSDSLTLHQMEASCALQYYTFHESFISTEGIFWLKNVETVPDFSCCPCKSPSHFDVRRKMLLLTSICLLALIVKKKMKAVFCFKYCSKYQYYCESPF